MGVGVIVVAQLGDDLPHPTHPQGGVRPMTSAAPHSSHSPAVPKIEFWFDFGSNYSYISAMRIADLAAKHGAQVLWRPILLGAIFRSFGWESSPFVLQKQKGAYVWKDMVRQCAKYNVPWVQPMQFPRGSVLPARVVLAAGDAPWVGDFVREVFMLNFAADKDIDSVDNVKSVLTVLGLPADELLQAAVTPENKQRLKAQTEAAQARSVFGAPTFFVNDEMFWGNDRLEDAFDQLVPQLAVA
jgi:2-hydroxychromene-2-carboxylate isomerase